MIFYYGGFPPPYGGVTIKNELLFSRLARQLPMVRMDTLMAKKNPLLLVRLTARLLLHRRGRFVVATSAASRRRITMLLWRFNRRAMESSVLIVMGGTLPEEARAHPALLKALGAYRQLFVETASMKAALERLGLTNVSVYPNCRADCRAAAILPTEAPLKCLFFSRVSPEKGADLVLDAAQRTPNIQYTFYGQPDADYREAFLEQVSALPNVTYQGIFPADGSNVCSLMRQYDLLLLPTCYPGEGLPGVLVEAKIAALPAIVSNAFYNAEAVEHGISGLVLPERSGACLAATLEALSQDPCRVDQLKQGALASADRYLIDNHIGSIAAQLQ